MAKVTQAGKDSSSDPQISFEMSDEGVFSFYFLFSLSHFPHFPIFLIFLFFSFCHTGVEIVILFAWWKTEAGDIYYERVVQQILVTA